MALTEEQERQWIAELQTMGEARVRFELECGKISPTFAHLTSMWLADKEREASRREEALQSEQTELMRRGSAAAERQATAAERANTRSNVAILIAVVSLIVAIFGFFKH